jgi:hypothetical protein
MPINSAATFLAEDLAGLAILIVGRGKLSTKVVLYRAFALTLQRPSLKLM